MDPSKRREMQQLVGAPVGEAIGIWSKPPGENDGPSHDEEELADIEQDLEVLHGLLAASKKLMPGPQKQKLLKSIESYIDGWEDEASKLSRKLRGR